MDTVKQSLEVDSMFEDMAAHNTLSKDELRNISRNFSSLFLKHEVNLSEDALRSLNLLLQRLLQTARQPVLPDSHRAAACNTLCGFLEQGIYSPDTAVQHCCSNETIWDEMFTIYLERRDDARPKPMRQILMTLVRLLNHGSLAKKADEVFNGDLVSVFTRKAVYKCLALICLNGDVTRAKPAMQVLEMFLNKNIVDISLLLDEFYLRSCEPDVRLGLGRTRNLNYSTNSSECVESFVHQILQWIQHPDTGSIVNRLLKSIFQSLQGQDNRFRPIPFAIPALPIWVVPIRQLLVGHPELMGTIGQHVLPDLLHLNPAESVDFVESLPLMDLQEGRLDHLREEDIRLCLLVVQTIEESKSHRMLSKTILGTWCSDDRSRLQTVCSILIAHSSSSIRIAALSTMLYSASSTRPLHSSVFDILRQNVTFFHAEADPKSRGDVDLEPHDLKLYFSAVAVDNINENNGNKDLMNHISFLKWYNGFLLEELRPTASYQRHITALKVLQISRKFIVFTDTRPFINAANPIQLLLDLMADPFDDIRGMAAALVKQTRQVTPSSLNLTHVDGPCPVSIGKDGSIASNLSQNHLTMTLSRVEAMAYSTGRADYADAVGRTCDLLYGHYLNVENLISRREGIVIILEHLLSALEHDIEIAQWNLRLTTSTTPFHGRLIALRYIVSRPDYGSSTEKIFWDEKEWGREWHNRLLDCCKRTWVAVSEILCFDSPEGHVLESSEDDGLHIGTKDTLSFSWRALKESSLLMHAILVNRGYRSPGRDCGLIYEDYCTIGSLAFKQLAQLRHRGAFSAVSQTFTVCCIRCLESEDQSVNSLPEQWYQETLFCIQEKATALTRRSAGLPAMITGILAAFPTGDFFDGVILDLQAIADAPIENAIGIGETRIPQVHALNCLKDVFTTTYSGLATEPHINITLEIAVGCLESDIWAIRNCGLMLLKALLSRLIGGNNTHLALHGDCGHFSKYVYDRNPNLPDLVLRLLAWNAVDQRQLSSNDSRISSSATVHSFQTVFTAIEIIKRFGIPPDHRTVITTVLMKQLGSPIWALREKTAEVLGFLVDEQTIIQEIHAISGHEWRQNELHGRLLCLKSMMVRRNIAKSDYYESMFPLLTMQFGHLVVSNSCPLTAATYLDIILNTLITLMRYKKMKFWHDSELFHSLKKKWQQTLCWSTVQESKKINPGDDLLIRALYFLLRFVRPDEDQIHPTSTVEAKLLLDLMDHDHPALSLILAYEEELGLGTNMTQEILKEYILIARRASDSRSRTEALKRVITSLDSSIDEERLLNLKACSSLPLEIASLLNLDVDEGADYIPNMELANLRLVLRGISLAEDGKHVPLNWKQQLDIWITMMKLAGDDISDISTRSAALSSVQSFQTVLRPPGSEPSSNPDFLGIYICLYDMLIDDDEDVRDQAALIVSWILSNTQFGDGQPATTSNCSLNPHVAKLNLVTFLCTSYAHSEDLYLVALRRLTSSTELKKAELATSSANYSQDPSFNEANSYLFPPLKSALSHARKENTALFAEEKQNLYIDPVAEAQHWADVLSRLSSTTNINPALTTHFRNWVTSGLVTLIQTAEAEFDGPLGWTSKPAVFTLGMRVISAAKLLVARDGCRRFSIVDGGEELEEEILGLLKRLLEVGRRRGMHVLWLRKIEEIVG